MAPTGSSFLADWEAIPGATGYRLDVSVTPDFSTYVPGFEDRAVGNVTTFIVSGLRPATKYYYRARPEGRFGRLAVGPTRSETTAATSGFVIVPTYDSSITGNPNAAAIEAMITRVIATFQSLISTPETVYILYRYASTTPEGKSLGKNSIGESDYVVYDIDWQGFINNLTSNATSQNDDTANASLPTTALSSNIAAASCNGRAIGFDTPPSMFANGRVADGGPYDGIVTLSSLTPLTFSRPVSGTSYDAQTIAEHETDEVIGFGSYIGSSDTNLRPQDLFSFSAPYQRNHTATGTRYFSVDNGVTNIVGFNQDKMGDYGDWLSGLCPQLTPYVQNAFTCAGQSSDITATSPEGINLDVIGYNLTSTTPANTIFGNISTRGFVGTNANVLIGGLIITGTQDQEVLVRAIGPSLPLSGTLTDPYLELHDSSGAIIASNDNWRSSQEAAIEATGLEPSSDNESAVLMTLSPGAYTAIVSGVGNTTGIGLVDVYDVNFSTDSKLANISTRGFVGTGANVLIGGVIIVGTEPTNALILALGPSLNLEGELADPVLTLYDSNGNALSSNDDWKSDNEAAITATGLAPGNDAESAILYDFAVGDYTAIVTGHGNATGVALVAAYQLDN